MKVDVVVAFYRHHAFAPFVAWGLAANAASIRNVFIVNDEPWGDNTPGVFRGRFQCLDHDHDGFGLCRSLNQGASYCTAEYILFCEGDEILPPGVIETNLNSVRPDRLLCCPKAYIEPPSDPIPNEDWTPQFLAEPDHRHRDYSRTKLSGRVWELCSGGHLLVPRAGHIRINGFDEGYGYGLHDYDYAARWLMEFGPQSVVFLPHLAPIWHVGTGKGRDLPAPESQNRFAKTLRRLRGMR